MGLATLVIQWLTAEKCMLSLIYFAIQCYSAVKSINVIFEGADYNLTFYFLQPNLFNFTFVTMQSAVPEV